MPPTAVAEFDQISKLYPDGLMRRKGVQALAGVTFQVMQGEVFGLLGPNRAGKTTLVKILLTLCRPSGGRAVRLGRPLDDRSTLARVGFVHENQGFPRYWSAASLLHCYGALSLVPETEVRSRVPRLLERVGLADRSREPVSRFSKGMIQRLGLAQALINDPDLLVLDEPTEGLDLAGRRLVHDIIAERRRLGRTVLLVSHAPADVEALCDRIAVIVQGRLVYLGSPRQMGGEPAAGVTRPLADALQVLYEKHRS